MKKIVVSIFVAALGSHAAAQTIGNSPYAAYGIGDIKYDNSVETRSMGGILTINLIFKTLRQTRIWKSLP